MSTEKPLPVIDHDSAPYWQAAHEGRLDIPLCGDCGKHHFYPRAICPYCHSDNLRFNTVSGRGRVHTFTTARRPAGPAFADDVPYVVALIELEEGPRMLSDLRDCPPEDAAIEMPVEVFFEDVPGSLSIPHFRPAKAS